MADPTPDTPPVSTPTTNPQQKESAMTTMRYRKKPVEIEAMQFAGTTAERHAVYQWVEEYVGSYDFTAEDKPDAGVSIDPADGRLVIRTLEGEMHADVGDWIIRGVQGEFYPCKPDIFAATYDAVGLKEKT